METLSKRWKIFVIHHSHTDIGYTEKQETIEQYHVGFIRQALKIVKEIQSGKSKEWKGFKWTCETFWAVERFLNQATQVEKQEFVDAIRRGDIELSGTYLNMTELADYDLLSRINAKAADYGRSIGHNVDSAMTADINGYSWGYAQSLIDAGIDHLFSCVHTHHGMFPLGSKQTPFWWETPNGEKLLVWNGEHYHFGNELGLCPDALTSYLIQDEFDTPATVENHEEIMSTRMKRYLAQLEEEQYPYDFVPVMVSGLMTDNASPNARIMDVINEWNHTNGHQVDIQMITLSEFFSHLKNTSVEIPTYKGDWPDWWSDGVNSTPMYTQVYRDAQRTLRKVKRLDPEQLIVSKEEIEAIEYQLVMYAEHTWGYHTSVSEPWHPNVQLLEVRKTAFAANANRLAHSAHEKIMNQQGRALLFPKRPLRYRVVNTEKTKIKQLVSLHWDNWETQLFKHGLEVIDESSQIIIPHQRDERSKSVSIEVELHEGEQKEFTLRPSQSNTGNTTSRFKLVGSDSVYDISDMYDRGEEKCLINCTQNSVESPFVKISWDGEGIKSWLNKVTGKEMVRSDQTHGAFTPVYEITPVTDKNNPLSIMKSRREMGRNRKGINVQRSVGRLVKVQEITRGPLYGIVELQYECEGMSYFSLFLKVYTTINRVDVSVRLHKDSVWEPENVYISLPFTTGNELSETLWIEKAGAIIRPYNDQLPGTLLDYYCIQEGLSYIDSNQSLSISIPDTPLIQLGPLEYRNRVLHTQQEGNIKPPLYAWIMSNYWETNFKATLGGFYEFRYFIECIENNTSSKQAIDHCHNMNAGFMCYRVTE